MDWFFQAPRTSSQGVQVVRHLSCGFLLDLVNVFGLETLDNPEGVPLHAAKAIDSITERICILRAQGSRESGEFSLSIAGPLCAPGSGAFGHELLSGIGPKAHEVRLREERRCQLSWAQSEQGV